MEVTDHQNHLQSVTDQAKELVNEINQLEAQAKNKRDMLLKLQGIIEYLQQTGVELPKETPAPPEPPVAAAEPVES
jgi:septal ring factor EnvC (AmiA/AmiB activator)